MLRISDFEGEHGEVIAELESSRDMILVEEDSFQQIWREQGCIHIVDLGIDIYTAVSCIYDEDTEDYQTDSSLYLFYEHDTNNQIYMEFGSSLSVCIYNYSHLVGKDFQDVDDVENLSCVYELHWNDNK